MRRILIGFGSLAALVLAGAAAEAQAPVKIGLIMPYSGQFADTATQMDNAVKLYVKQKGDTVAGRKLEFIRRDTGGVAPDVAKRLAQELIVRDQVDLLAGFVLTPNALAAGDVSAEAKKLMVVMNAAAARLTEKSPFMVRTSFDYPSTVPPIAQWAAQKGSKKAYVILADYAPGHDAEAAFLAAYKATGGEIVGSVRTPLVTLDFSPYMQRVKDARPDLLFAFVNGGDVAPAFIREYREKGLEQAGIQLVGTGDIVDEAILETIGERALGLTTVYPYSMHHKSELNARFVRDFKAQRDAKARPTIMAVAAYDGMAAIYAALQKAGGKADGAALLQAMQGLQLDSPRGRIAIDAKTRDIVQDQYIRRVEKVGEVLANVEFETYPATKG